MRPLLRTGSELHSPVPRGRSDNHHVPRGPPLRRADPEALPAPGADVARGKGRARRVTPHRRDERRRGDPLPRREDGLESDDATAEVKRYTQSPTQPQPYLMWKIQILEIVKEYKKAHPKTSLRPMHDAILGCGSLPPQLMRERMFARRSERSGDSVREGPEPLKRAVVGPFDLGWEGARGKLVLREVVL